MQIFAGEYLQDREKASCGCKFLQGSICKIEKKQVADALFGCGVSASREKASCGCIFWVWSICKTEKKQVVDALFGCGVSARQRKSKL